LHLRADIVGALLLAALVTAGCARHRTGSTTLARVGTVELTAGDLATPGDSATLRHPPRDAVDDWVLTELLYQEATRRGITEDDEMQRQMEAVRRRLAVARLLDHEVYGVAEDTIIAEDTLRARYRNTQQELLVREDVIQLSTAAFADRDGANAFRTRLLRGAPWQTAVDSSYASPPSQNVARRFFTAATLYPPELWKVARTLNPGEVSFPVKAAEATWVVQLHSARHAGEPADFDYAREELRDREIIERRRARYDRLVAALRTRRAGDIHIERFDTARVTE
jgi:hypothetical protein